MRAAILTFAACLLLVSTNASAKGGSAGFDCDKAGAPIEHAICDDAELSALDWRLNGLYAAARQAVPEADRGKLKREQRQWLAARVQACGVAAGTPTSATVPDSVKTCLSSLYLTRIAALEQVVGKTPDKAALAVAEKGHEIVGDRDIARYCVRFNQVLAEVPNDALRPYVAVSPPEDFALERRGNTLCLDGLRHGQSYEVRFKTGLPGQMGALPGDLRAKVDIPQRSPSAKFADQAYVLPKAGPKNVIPVTTVNRDDLPLNLYRVAERNLHSLVDLLNIHDSLDGYKQYQLIANYGQLAWSGRLKIDNVPNKEVVTHIPIDEIAGELQPGAYVLSEVDGNEDRWRNRPTQWFVVTDLGLSNYIGEDGFSVQVRTLSSAKPKADATVRVIGRNNMVLAEAATGKDGWVDFPGALGQGQGGMFPLYVSAETEEGDFVYLPIDGAALDLSSHGVAGRAPPGPMEAFAYADRGVYRPGEQARIGVLLRDDKGAAVPNLPLTAVIKRPDGSEYARSPIAIDGLGGGLFPVELVSSAVTGRWSVELYADVKRATIGGVGFQVEEFTPEKLKVAVAPSETGIAPGTSSQITIQADYLFGAPGGGLTAGGRAILRTAKTPFPGLDGFHFGLVDETISEILPLKDAKTNASGAATLTLDALKIPDHYGPLEIRVQAEVADADGRPNRGYGTIPVRTHDRFVGLKPGFNGEAVGYGQTAPFAAVVVDPTGAPVADAEVTVKWIDENRDYRWYRQDGEWRFEYTKHDIELKNRVMRTDGKGRVAFDFVSTDWGHYRVDVYDAQGGAAASYAYRVGWSQATRSPDTPDMLELSLERTDAAPGEMIEGFVKGPFAGRVSIVVANKSVLWRGDIALPKKGESFSIPVAEDWGVGAYVMATAYRPGKEDDQRGPGRAVGLSWVSVGKAAKTLSVSFDPPAEAQPNRPVTIPITVVGPAVTAGKPIRAAVFAIDEGVLRLTQYQAPRPAEALLGQQRLQLAYRDLYGHLIAPLKGRPGVVETGGDEAGLGNLGGVDKRAFKITALTSDLFDVGPGGKSKVTFDLPDFNGQLRLFAVAYSAGAIGGGESSLLVRDKVVAELLPPRFLAPGDTAKAAVRVTNMAGGDGDYALSLAAEGPVTVRGGAKTMRMKKGDTANAAFDLIGQGVGNAVLTLALSGPDGLEIKRRVDISVRAAQPWISERRLIDLTAGLSHDIPADALDRFVPGTGTVSLSIANRPQIDVAALVAELDNYPYGCLEQTTSSTLPLLYFAKLKALWPSSTFDETTLDDRIAYGIRRVLSKQRADGAFGLWNNTSSPEPWLTAYATDFLLEAKALGHAVPYAALGKALDWMESGLNKRREDPSTLAYWTLVLSRAGRLTPDEVRYNQAQISPQPWDTFAKAGLAAAGGLHGNAIKKVSLADFSRPQDWLDVYWTRYYDNYGSQLRDVAAALALQPAVFASDQDKLGALELLAELYGAKPYTSTQEKGWLLRAALAVLGGSGGPMNFSVGGARITQEKPYVVAFTSLKKRGAVTVRHEGGDAPLFVTQTVSGVPSDPIPPRANGFSITRTYHDESGSPVDPSTVSQGSRMIVKLTVHHNSGFEKRALIADLLPAGFEIEPASIGGLTAALLDKHFKDRDEPLYKAERDDRYVAAYDLPTVEGTVTSVYVVRAAIPGSYVHPAPFVEDMYKPEFSAIGKVDAITVTDGP